MISEPEPKPETRILANGARLHCLLATIASGGSIGNIMPGGDQASLCGLNSTLGDTE